MSRYSGHFLSATALSDYHQSDMICWSICGCRARGLRPCASRGGLPPAPAPLERRRGGRCFSWYCFGAPPPFFLLFRVRPSAFFLALRGSWPLGCVWLCFVSIVHLSVGRGFFASLTGRFCGRASAGVGGVSFCFRLSIKSGSLSIFLAFLQIFS